MNLEEAKKLETGDIVFLNSGSPELTVEEIFQLVDGDDDDADVLNMTVKVSYYNAGLGKIQSEIFPYECLSKENRLGK